MLPIFLLFALAVTEPVSPTAGQWREPLRSVLEALNVETDVTLQEDAVRRLGAYGDPSLIPVFDALLYRHHFNVQRAAVEALGSVAATAATRILASVAANWPEEVAEKAFDALGRQQTEAAAESLDRLQRRGGLEHRRRQWAAASLELWYPQWRDRYAPIVPKTRTGLPLFVLAAGGLGAVDLMAVGFLGLNPDLGVPIGILSGGAIGLGAGYLVGKDRSTDLTQGMRAVTYQNWGLLSGVSLGLAYAADYPLRSSMQRDRLVAGMAALGATAGFAAALNDEGPLSPRRQLFVEMSGLAGAAAAGGILLWLPDPDRSLPPVAFVNAAALGSLVVARRRLPKLRLSNDDDALIFSAPLLGGWFAPWSAYAMNPDGPSERVTGWFLFGTGAGWLSGIALAHALEGTSDAVLTGDIFAVYGSAFGAGIPLALGAGKQERVAAMLAGGAVAFGLGAELADKITLNPPAQALVLISTAFGSFQGAGFAAYARQSNDQRRGWGFIGATAGAAGALGASRVYDITPALTSAVIAGQGLGAWVSVLGGDRWGLAGRDLLLASLIGTDVGLLGSALLVGPAGVRPERVGWAGVFGLGSAGIAATGAALATASREGVETSALAGTGAGIVLGAALAPHLGAPSAPKLSGVPFHLVNVQAFIPRLDGSSPDRGLLVTLAF